MVDGGIVRSSSGRRSAGEGDAPDEGGEGRGDEEGEGRGDGEGRQLQQEEGGRVGGQTCLPKLPVPKLH